jgi:hypothetical protein
LTQGSLTIYVFTVDRKEICNPRSISYDTLALFWRVLCFSSTIILFGCGAATGGLAVAGAIGGTTTIANEAVFATVQQDAKRTATQIADRIADYYRTQGWSY